MSQKDWLRPTTQPAQMIYDAWHKETENRTKFEYVEWCKNERKVVFETANLAAKKYGLKSVTIEEVEAAEQNAYGSVDYGAKWVYGVLDKMRGN